MKKIVIIGASAAGHALAQGLRAKNKDCQITLVTEEAYPCYDRRRLFDYFAGMVREKELFLCSTDAYARENIILRRETQAVGINCDRGTVYLKMEDKRDSIPFDFLAICSGKELSLPELPGIRKEGVFTLGSLADVRAAKSAVINGPVCLSGEWNAGAAALTAALRTMKKDVMLITPSAVPSGELEGVTVINSAISEFIGESGLQAVKLREGKIIGTSFCVLTGPWLPASGICDGTDVRRENGFIVVDGDLRTSRENIFACGSVTGKCDSWEEAVKQASTVSVTLAGLLSS